MNLSRPPRIELAPGLVVPRLLVGLWQVADIERSGQLINPDQGADALAAYVQAGFDGFDMADHYGSAEVICGRLLSRGIAARAFTKWCPAPGVMDAAVVAAGVDRSRERMCTPSIDLLQFHWWQYAHPGYIDAMLELDRLRAQGRIRHLGLTNFDTDHLRLLLLQGIPIRTNQVSFSLLDRRAAGRMSAICQHHGVRLLAYGTLGGGFLTDRWVGAAEPDAVADWSKSKYKRFIDAIGGWEALQTVLRAARQIADKHRVSVANVAVRWVLEQPAVGAVIVGARLGEREHRADNLAVFSFALDTEDHQRLDEALSHTRPPPGDCGDEYRKPPFLTASGDLSHHLDSFERVYVPRGTPPNTVQRALQPSAHRSDPAEGQRQWISSGSLWEPIAGYARAVRDGARVMVSGTTATHGAGTVIAPGDAEAQTVYILDKITAGLESLGARLSDVVRTRIYLRDAKAWQGVAEVHGRYFGEICPANTMLGGAVLIGDYEVEIEAEAIVQVR